MRIAVSLRHVDARDIPATAKTTSVTAPLSSASATASVPGPSQKKRKAAYEAAFGSQTSVPQLSLSQTPGQIQQQTKTPGSQVGSRVGSARQVIVVEDEVEEVVPSTLR